jgi:CRP-like cAMP-binding protein
VTNPTDDLQRVPLFADLNGRQLKKLAAHLHERRFPAGASIVQERTMSGVGFFVITEGEAVVSVGGKQVTTLSAGDHFGELALVTEAERTATVTASTPLRCFEIPFWDFREFALANPDVTWKLLQHVVSVLQPVR